MSVKEAFDPSGRKAIITGGSRGLGLQIAEALGEMGAELVLAARRTDELDQAVAHLAAQGIGAHGIAADLGKPEAVSAFADAALARLGHCDILVNNAGATWGAPAGLRGNAGEGNQTIAYNTTKGGVVNFTRALAGEWGAHGITANALAPGFFPSKMTRNTLEKIGDDEDLKGAAVLFCSDAGKHITGQILAVDGGVTAV